VWILLFCSTRMWFVLLNKLISWLWDRQWVNALLSARFNVFALVFITKFSSFSYLVAFIFHVCPKKHKMHLYVMQHPKFNCLISTDWRYCCCKNIRVSLREWNVKHLAVLLIKTSCKLATQTALLTETTRIFLSKLRKKFVVLRISWEKVRYSCATTWWKRFQHNIIYWENFWAC
jgi:hypothetical protein